MEKEAFGADAYSFRVLKYLLTYADIFVVAVSDDVLVGYICGEYILDRGHIISIAVKNEYRGRGIGSELLNIFIKDAIDRKIREVYLEVAVDNLNAINFYLKRNFHITDRIRGYYRAGTDAYIMSKKIGEYSG